MSISDKIKQVTVWTVLETGVTYEDIMSTDRTAEVADARHMAWYVAHRYAGATLSQIGTVFDRDHSTVSHGVRKIARRMMEPGEVRDMVKDIAQAAGVAS